MDIDDILDLIAVAIFVFTTLAGLYLAIRNYRAVRLIKQLRANPEFNKQIEEILREKARRGEE